MAVASVITSTPLERVFEISFHPLELEPCGMGRGLLALLCPVNLVDPG